MEYHELANIFPLVDGEEFQELVKDIKANGQREAITTYQGKILDGRNRYRACLEAGVEPTTKQYVGNDPLSFVVSLNLHRRHLKSSQRAAIAVESEGLLQKLETEAKARKRHGGEGRPIGDNLRELIPAGYQGRNYREADTNRISHQLAEIFGTNRKYIEQVKQVKQNDPEKFAAVKRGEVNMHQLKREEIRARRIETIKEASANNEELLTNKLYPVIYADPPWRYDFTKTESRGIENQYPTMTLEDICSLKVPAQDDAVLFMWTTSPLLEKSFMVMKAWGFEYKTSAVWDKQIIGMGYYFRIQHEMLLVGMKGSVPTPEPYNRPSSVFSYRKGEHSVKPEEVAEAIEQMYPELPKLEMFSRTTREGWDVWGNEA